MGIRTTPVRFCVEHGKLIGSDIGGLSAAEAMRLNTGKLPSESQSFVLGNWYSYPVEINDFH